MSNMFPTSWIKNLYIGSGRNSLTASAALIIGNGSSTSPLTNASADKNFLEFFTKSTATTGTSRGLYQRLYLSSGAGGEAGRFFTTVENNAPADTCNGVHSSLNFGASAGNITGEGQAVRGTLHVPNRSLTGTTAAVKAEIWSEGTSSALGGTTSFLRMTNAGNATGMAAVDTSGFLFHVDGLTAGTGKILRTNAPATLAASLRVKVGATTYYLPLYSAAV